jgi:copper chaperone CopZ
MKLYKLLLFLPFLFFGLQSSTIEDEVSKESFKVWGNCEMCKKTIEKAVNKVEGVINSRWNVAKKRISVKYYTHKTNLDSIQQAIAAVGYDTEKYKATDEIYNGLHGCCKYNRN